jgi:LAGLIDADG DNA endonuclease family protein
MFTFDKKEKPLYMHIKEIFGTGSFYEVKSTNVCRYTISEKYSLIELISLINGKFRTPKIEYLHKAIDYINTVHNTNIKKLPIDNSNLLTNP